MLFCMGHLHAEKGGPCSTAAYYNWPMLNISSASAVVDVCAARVGVRLAFPYFYDSN